MTGGNEKSLGDFGCIHDVLIAWYHTMTWWGLLLILAASNVVLGFITYLLKRFVCLFECSLKCVNVYLTLIMKIMNSLDVLDEGGGGG